MTGPSPNLGWHELACKDGTPYPDIWKADRAVQLATAFEYIRSIHERPIRILSAYRSPAHNLAIGGVERSQHMEGRALDLRPPEGVTVADFHASILAAARDVPALGIRGVGLYPTFVHFDVRPGDAVVTWNGQRPLADLT